MGESPPGGLFCPHVETQESTMAVSWIDTQTTIEERDRRYWVSQNGQRTVSHDVITVVTEDPETHLSAHTEATEHVSTDVSYAVKSETTE